jgi:hypothetical protein
MRKEFRVALEKFIIALNKDIIDLDKLYIKDNYPRVDIDAIKAEESKHFDERHFVYDKLVERCPNLLGRFQVAYKILSDKGNRVRFVVLDRKINPTLLLDFSTRNDVADTLPNAYFQWHPLKAKKGWIYPNDVKSWINNVLCNLNLTKGVL